MWLLGSWSLFANARAAGFALPLLLGRSSTAGACREVRDYSGERGVDLPSAGALRLGSAYGARALSVAAQG